MFKQLLVFQMIPKSFQMALHFPRQMHLMPLLILHNSKISAWTKPPCMLRKAHFEYENSSDFVKKYEFRALFVIGLIIGISHLLKKKEFDPKNQTGTGNATDSDVDLFWIWGFLQLILCFFSSIFVFARRMESVEWTSLCRNQGIYFIFASTNISYMIKLTSGFLLMASPLHEYFCITKNLDHPPFAAWVIRDICCAGLFRLLLCVFSIFFLYKITLLGVLITLGFAIFRQDFFKCECDSKVKPENGPENGFENRFVTRPENRSESVLTGKFIDLYDVDN